MPLMPGKSPKAFSKNVKTEMEHGKPQDQALAIAYSIKRKGKKKMAEGGAISAKDEKRPMPDNTYDDAKTVGKNSGDKPPKMDSWTDRPDIPQTTKGPKTTPIKHPKMVPQSTYSTRLRTQEDDLQEYMRTNEGPQHQPPAEDDEEGPDRQGPAVHDMEDEHSTHKKPYAKGGEIEESDKTSHNINEHTDQEPEDAGIQLKLRGEESDLMDSEDPSEDEGLETADSLDEEGQDRHGPEVPDMEREHSNGRKPYAEGGRAEAQDMDEEDVEHAASIASAVMAKMKAEGRFASGSEDEDEAVMAAEGGEILPKHPTKILSHDSIYSDDSDQADLRRNAEEDANEEDQTSFNALRKENYSESAGLDALDQPEDSNEHADSRETDSENEHDQSTVQKIMRKMKTRSPITR